MTTFGITSTVKQHPEHPYETIKNDIMGKRYNLSLSFVGPTRAAKLNQQYRKKSYTPNVLSFPLDAENGEIVICPQVAVKEAGAHGLTPTDYVAFLFIHGLLHLKGLDHSDEMDKAENRYLKKYGLRA